MGTPADRKITIGLAIWLLVSSTHCGGRVLMPQPVTIPQTTELTRRADLGRVAIVVSDARPSVTTGGMAVGKCKGAAVGAGRAVGGYLGAAFSGGCGGAAACGLYALIVLTLAPVVAIGGSIAGSVGSVSKKEVRRMRAFLDDAASASHAGQVITNELIAYLPDGIDAEVSEGHLDGNPRVVLEIEPPTVSGRGSGGNTPMRWTIATRARLVRASDGSVLHTGSYTYRSCGRKLREWIGSDLALLRAELERADKALARKIVDELLLLDPIGRRGPLVERSAASKRKKRKPRLGDSPRGYVGLRPIEPPTLGAAHVIRRNGLPRFKFSRTVSTTPTLRWEAFEPRETDGRVEDTTYEIRIARAERGLPAEVVYREDGLREPRHQVERRLAPDQVYFWTVRARYRVEGRPRVTEWGGIHTHSFCEAKVPGIYSYRFRTASHR